MKCIRCEHDSKYKERPNKRCPKCGGQFAFEPRTGDPLTDPAFQHAVEAVSASGRVRWGVEHLYYEVCRRKRIASSRFIVFGVFLAAFAAWSVVWAVKVHPGWWLGVVAAAVVGLILVTVKQGSRLVRVDLSTFNRMWERWCAVHGAPASVIARKQKPRKQQPAEPDLADYSFDRAVICDRARTVDLLLANNFHFENNCAVLSIEGYPPGPFETVRTMLQRNPRLQVFALHDATPAGCRMAHKLASDPNWFAGRVKVIDVGLRPVHAARFQGLLLSSKDAAVTVREGITPLEAAWLAKYILELAAIRPEQVLKRLFRALNLPINPDDYPEDVIYLAARDDGRARGSDADGGGDGSTFAADAGDADGPADAFG